MKKRLTVAIYSGVSTSTTFIERLIKGLTENNVEVLVFGTKNGPTASSSLLKYHCYGTKINKLIRLVKYSVLLFTFKTKDKGRLDRIIKSNTRESHRLLKLKYYPVLYYKPDIFHLQWTKSIKDWVWVEEFGMKLVVSLRGTHITISPKTQAFYKKTYLELFPKVSAFHAVSNAIANEVENYNVSSSKVHVVKSGLPISEFQFQKNKERNKPIKILSVGRPHFAKGYNFALDAMAILKDKEVDFNYSIIGVLGDEKIMYQHHQLQLQDSVTLTEALPFERVREEMLNADILLLPSIEEGLANVVLEAMALGTLVLSSDCGGMPEVVVHNETGILFNNRDINQIAKAILEVNNLSDKRYNEITKNARLKIEKEHSLKKMNLEMLDLYENVINNE